MFDKYRLADVVVKDSRGHIIHEGASSCNIQWMMNDLFDFLYESQINPIIKSAIYHFYFVYIHPFSDGNGRTSRATSYVYLVKEGYDIFNHFSISALIAQKKSRYYKCIKDVEDNELDMTYFIEFILEVMSDSIDAILDKYTRKHIENYTKKNRNCDYKKVNRDMNYLVDIGIFKKSKLGKKNLYSIDIIN